MNTSQPLITVYMPTYNRLSLLKRAIDSVLEQTYENFELIIVDDCSTDGTQEFLRGLEQTNHKIRIHLKEKNTGACDSRNIAIEMACGEYITGLDDDDFFLPNRLEVFVNNKDRLENCIFLTANIEFFRPFEQQKKRSRLQFLFKNSYYSFDHLLALNLAGNQVFCKASTLKKNKFDTAMPMWQDFELWLRLTRNNRFYHINHSTYVVDEQHDGMRISAQGQEKLQYAYCKIIQEFNLSKYQQKVLTLHFRNYGLRFSHIGSLSLLMVKPRLYYLSKFLRINLSQIRSAI